MLFQNGTGAAEPSGISSDIGRSSSGPGTSGATDSSCSRPSFGPTAQIIALRIGRPVWVIVTVDDAAVRPGLAWCTSMSTGSGRATPR